MEGAMQDPPLMPEARRMKAVILGGVLLGLALFSAGVPAYVLCAAFSFLGGLILLSLEKRFRPAAWGMFLVALSWVVNGFMKTHGMKTWFSFDELFRIPGYLILLVPFRPLGLRWCRSYFGMAQASIVLFFATTIVQVYVFTAETGSLAKDSFLYALIFIAMFWLLTPRIEEVLSGESPLERFLWIFGLLVLWLESLLNIPEEVGITPSLLASDSVAFLGPLFVSCGIYAEARRLALRFWSFGVCLGSVLYSWMLGVLFRTSSLDPGYLSWVIIGSVVLFLAAFWLLLGYNSKLIHSERKVWDWVHLLERMSCFASSEDEKDPSLGFDQIFLVLKMHIVGLSGMELRTTPPVRIGQETPHFCPLVIEEQVLGRLFFYKEEHAREIELLMPLLASRIQGVIHHISLKLASQTDSLTGCLNRRGFYKAIEKTLRCRRIGRGFALAFLDLDHLKEVNDKFGHGVGDNLISFTAQELRNSIRSEDILARWGGDEFVVALFTKDIQEAYRILERVTESQKRACFNGNGEKVRGGFSGGIVWVDLGEAYPIDRWIQLADKALYAAKRQGRGVLVIQSPT